MSKISRYTKAGQDVHHKPPGSVMVVEFEIEGQTFTALNGGPNFKFNEAVSFQVRCETQAEVDYFWGELTQGGQEGPCGWLKDKFGLSWQVVPAAIPKMMTAPENSTSQRSSALTRGSHNDRRHAAKHQTSIHVIQANSAAITQRASAVQRLRRASAAPMAATVSGASTRPSRVMSSN
jgi:predicted 3-demethylubiquinone-9 3-methyltransferase (glyoxalase superfamily)